MLNRLEDIRDAVQRGFTLQRSGQLSEAEQIFRMILGVKADHAESLYGLSRVLEQQGRHEEALLRGQQAVAAAPKHPGLQYNLGLMLEAQGAVTAACVAFSEAVRLKPDFFQAWNNLGLVQQDIGSPQEAQRCFERVLGLRPGHIGALNNLAGVLESQGREAEALACLEQALRSDPAHAMSRINLGRLNLRMGRFQAALDCFGQASAAGSEDVLLRKDRVAALVGLRRFDEARRSLELMVSSSTAEVESRYRLAQVCAQMNDAQAASAVYGEILGKDSTDWRARLGQVLMLPIIHSSTETLHDARFRFETGLRDLVDAAERGPVNSDPATLARQLEWDNFFLAYQGEDDTDLQRQYGRVLHELLKRAAPEYLAPLEKQGTRPWKMRIGFVSSFFRDCTVGHYFKPWITELDSGRFEKYVYSIGGRDDSFSASIREAAHHPLRLGGSILEMARRIREDELDALVFPELGMDGKTFALAGFRLAPLQCAAWGHPVTSGHPTVDCYFSSAWMEPPDGRSHYTEELVQLPGLGTCYVPAESARTLTRTDLGLPQGCPLYLLPQSLFKIHPDNDRLIGELLRRDRDGILVLFESENPWITRAFMDRFGAAMSRFGIDAQRIVMLKAMPRDSYLAVNHFCDVMLDTLHWSGGNTTLDALSVGLPIVTQWGRFMRGRQSAGMLSAMGLQDLIASDHDHFIGLALDIAHDVSHHKSLQERILEGRSQLFGDLAPIRHLENFFLSKAA